MIEKYFGLIEKLIEDFPFVATYTLTKKVYNHKQGYIRGAISFANGYHLDFVEVKNIDTDGKLKYRYQYMDAEKEEVFRYDNAPHHRRLKSFPHHKHIEDEVIASPEPTLESVFFEIAQYNRS